MPGSDSSTACAWGVRLAPSPTGPGFAAGAAEVSRFSCGEFPGVPGFPRPRRTRSPLAKARRAMWPSPSVNRVGARNSGLRGSIARPPVPLSTLHPRCRHRRRMTRGQRGSLLLRCRALSSPTLRRFIPALSDGFQFSWLSATSCETCVPGIFVLCDRQACGSHLAPGGVATIWGQVRNSKEFASTHGHQSPHVNGAPNASDGCPCAATGHRRGSISPHPQLANARCRTARSWPRRPVTCVPGTAGRAGRRLG